MYCHTEQRRTPRFYIVEIVRHRGTVGTWRNREYLRVLLMFLSTSLQSSGLQDLLKRLLPKQSAICTLRFCRSLCLRHLRDIACAFTSVFSPSLCAFYMPVALLYHSIFRRNLFMSFSLRFSLGNVMKVAKENNLSLPPHWCCIIVRTT